MTRKTTIEHMFALGKLMPLSSLTGKARFIINDFWNMSLLATARKWYGIYDICNEQVYGDDDGTKYISQIKTILTVYKSKKRLNKIRLDFVAPFPYFAEDYGGVKSIKNGQRHTDIHDDDPRPKPEKFQLQWIRVRPRLFQRIDRPHGKVAHLKNIK